MNAYMNVRMRGTRKHSWVSNIGCPLILTCKWAMQNQQAQLTSPCPGAAWEEVSLGFSSESKAGFASASLAMIP